MDDPARSRDNWQSEAWDFYDGPDGEGLKFGVTWLSNLISKARLRAAKVVSGDTEPEPLESGPAVDAVEALAGGVEGQSQLLRSFVVQLSVPGVGYLLGSSGLADITPDTDNADDQWRVVSQDVLRLKNPATPNSPPVYELQYDEGAWKTLPPEDTMVVKFWRPHQRWFWKPDSPTHAAIGALRELRRINQYIDATLVSRLAGAGLLVFPTEARFPTAPTETQGQHPFITEVLNVMMTAVRQPGTAAQIVPIPVEVPAEHVDKFKLVNWSTELSDRILEMRESAQKRVATALDVPPEVIMGMGDLTHWNAWQISEDAINVHAEPLLELITGDLTRNYLTPVLKAQGEDTEDIVLWADTSAMSAKPDQSKPALDLYDRGELGGDSTRRVLGFAESDAPDDEELAAWAFRKLVSDSTLAAAALKGLGITLPEVTPTPITVTSPSVSGEGAPEPPPTDDTGEGPPPKPTSVDDEPPEQLTIDRARVLVLEGHVKRALEVARNRMKGSAKVDPLEGVFRLALATLGDIGLDPVLTVRELGSYCRTMLNEGVEYDRGTLERLVRGTVDCADCS